MHFSNQSCCGSGSGTIWAFLDPNWSPRPDPDIIICTNIILFIRKVVIFVLHDIYSVKSLENPQSLIATLFLDIGSIADPDLVPFWPLNPGSGIGFFPDPGSRIPNPYFWELSDNILGKKLYNCLKIGLNFFLQHFKTRIIFNFVKFVAT
jgi:hypothetical protein